MFRAGGEEATRSPSSTNEGRAREIAPDYRIRESSATSDAGLKRERPATLEQMMQQLEGGRAVKDLPA